MKVASRFLLIFSLALLFVGCFTLIKTTTDTRAAGVVEESERAFRGRKWTLAKVGMSERLQRDPRNKEVLFKLGICNHYLGQYGVARENFEQARDGEIFPNYLVDYNIACTYARELDKPKMLDSLERSIREGFKSTSTLASEEDFVKFRADKDFIRVVAKLHESADKHN